MAFFSFSPNDYWRLIKRSPMTLAVIGFIVATFLALVYGIVDGFLQPPPLSMSELLTDTEFCFETKHGIVVERRDKAKCPSKSKVEEATETIFSRIYRQEHHLFGYRIIFTGRLINCRVDKDLNLPPKYTEGCGQDGVMVITKYHFWKGTAVHEFGHAIRFRDGIDPDPEHGDCNYWYQVEHRRCAGW